METESRKVILRAFGSVNPKQRFSAPSSPNRILAFLIGVGLLLAMLRGFGLWIRSQHGDELRSIDHSADTLEILGMEEGSSKTACNPDCQTIYRNSRSRVTLTLPGIWKSANTAALKKPDLSHRFCVLSSPEQLSAMFWREVGDVLGNLDGDARTLVSRYRESGDFDLTFLRVTYVLGRECREIDLVTRTSKYKVKLLITRVGSAVYLLAITGPPNAEGIWRQIEGALPNSVDIKQ